MSNNKPKPIIIKSNKGEDTLPLPITKQTDWNETKELKEITRKQKKKRN